MPRLEEDTLIGQRELPRLLTAIGHQLEIANRLKALELKANTSISPEMVDDALFGPCH